MFKKINNGTLPTKKGERIGHLLLMEHKIMFEDFVKSYNGDELNV